MSLVLTRKVGEALVITGGGIPPRRLYIVAIDGNTVRLAIDAPAQVNIVREELLHPSQKQSLARAALIMGTTFLLLRLITLSGLVPVIASVA